MVNAVHNLRRYATLQSCCCVHVINSMVGQGGDAKPHICYSHWTIQNVSKAYEVITHTILAPTLDEYPQCFKKCEINALNRGEVKDR